MTPAKPIGQLSGFRSDVQALRGLAVLLVVLYHAGGIVPAGFIGVDIFFVISGFVVGRLIVSDVVTEGRFDWRRFYARRIRRLLPALAAMLTVVLLLTPFFAALSVHDTAAKTGRAAALFFANVQLMNTEYGYFNQRAELNPLLHTWSLSIEEQFYVLFPLIMSVSLWRFVRRFDRIQVLRVIVLLLGVSSFLLCLKAGSSEEIWGVKGERFSFFMPFTRAWEFTIGVALTLLPRWRERKERRVRDLALANTLLSIGVGLIAFSSLALESVSPFPGYAALMPTTGAALVILSGSLRAATSSIPSHLSRTAIWTRPLQWMGDISYSWYLWHWPFIVFAETTWTDTWWVRTIAAAFSLGPSVLSWRYIEQRFRERREPRSRRRALLVGSVAIALPMTSVLVFDSVRDGALSLPKVEGWVTDPAPYRVSLSDCGSETFFTGQQLNACVWGRREGPRIALVGDSHALHHLETLIGAAENVGAEVTIAAIPGCPFGLADLRGIFSLRCKNFIERILQELEADPPEAVFVSQFTVGYLSGIMEAQGGTTVPLDEIDTRHIEELESDLIRAFTRLTRTGSIVTIINDMPMIPGWSPLQCSPIRVQLGRCRERTMSQDDLDRRDMATVIESRVAEAAGASTWDPFPILCPTGRCSSIDGDEILWVDDNHVTTTASRRLIPAMTAVLDDILGPWLVKS